MSGSRFPEPRAMGSRPREPGSGLRILRDYTEALRNPYEKASRLYTRSFSSHDADLQQNELRDVIAVMPSVLGTGSIAVIMTHLCEAHK